MIINDTKPDINIQEREYRRLLGFPPDHEPGEQSRVLMDWARQWYKENGKPWIYARSSENIALDDGVVQIDGVSFSSRRLHEQLVQVRGEGAILVAVSAGGQLEEKARQLWLEEKPDEYFFLEIFGSALVEHLVTSAGFRLCEWADRQGAAVLPHDSPGYPGWDISEQKRLLDILTDGNEDAIPGTLQVLETGMMQPKKSLLAAFGVTQNVEQIRRLTTLIPCRSCSHQNCQYRRAPVRSPLPQLEEIRQLRRQANIDSKKEPQ